MIGNSPDKFDDDREQSSRTGTGGRHGLEEAILKIENTGAYLCDSLEGRR